MDHQEVLDLQSMAWYVRMHDLGCRCCSCLDGVHRQVQALMLEGLPAVLALQHCWPPTCCQ